MWNNIATTEEVCALLKGYEKFSEVANERQRERERNAAEKSQIALCFLFLFIDLFTCIYSLIITWMDECFKGREGKGGKKKVLWRTNYNISFFLISSRVFHTFCDEFEKNIHKKYPYICLCPQFLHFSCRRASFHAKLPTQHSCLFLATN